MKAALLLCMLAAPAMAQVVSLPPSRAIACMTPALAERGTPAYPPDLLERKDDGEVHVELVFSRPDEAPAVRDLTEAYQSPDFLRSVLDHVRQLRVPCMPAGAEPVRIVQKYRFQPGDARPVLALPALDRDDAERERQVECLMRITPEKLPDYPRRSLQEGEQGNFLVRLRFSDAAAAPVHEIVAGPRLPRLRHALAEFMPGYRLPCLRGEPKEADILFKFRIDGGERIVIPDVTLRSLVQGAEFTPPARFDFATMDCPFDVRVTHYQPFKPHVVGQLGAALESRRDFLHWLSQVRLRMSSEQQLALLGDTFTVSVPCGRLVL